MNQKNIELDCNIRNIELDCNIRNIELDCNIRKRSAYCLYRDIISHNLIYIIQNKSQIPKRTLKTKMYKIAKTKNLHLMGENGF